MNGTTTAARQYAARTFARTAPAARGRAVRSAFAPGETFEAWYRRTLPDGYSVPAHVVYLCGLVQRLVDGDIQRLAVSLPPGHAKSETITRRLPSYWAARHPDDVVVQTGYSQRFAEKHLSYPTREIAREAGTLAPSATALDEWEWTNGARLVARGVGSAPTGVNPISLLVCDDPIKDRAQAASAVERDNVWQWWTGSIVQRFWPRTRAVIVATRWAEDDLIGRLKKQDDPANGGPGEWTFVNLPALAVEGETDPLGREPGEALWPEAKPAAFLHRLRAEMGAYDFEALFQGNPTPREGSLFKVGALAFCDPADVPPLTACRAWDLAATHGGGDYTAGVLVGRAADGRIYVPDVVRGQWDSAERDARMVQTAQADGRGVRIHLPQDPGQAGKDQAARLVRMLAGYTVRAEPVTGGKQTRADGLASQIAAGNVTVVRAPWTAAFVDELRAFPGGAHDDMCDSCSDGFTEIAAPVAARPRSRVSSPLSY